MLLSDKICIITGAASARGIGRATARLFAQHGARTVILDLDEAQAKAAAADLGEAHLGLRLRRHRQGRLPQGGGRQVVASSAASTCWSTMPASPSR